MKQHVQIFVESTLGMISVYTNLPEDPELHIIERVWQDPTLEMQESAAYLEELLAKGQIRELNVPQDWSATADLHDLH